MVIVITTLSPLRCAALMTPVMADEFQPFQPVLVVASVPFERAATPKYAIVETRPYCIHCRSLAFRVQYGRKPNTCFLSPLGSEASVAAAALPSVGASGMSSVPATVEGSAASTIGASSSLRGLAPGWNEIRSLACARHWTAISEGPSEPGGAGGRTRPFGRTTEPAIRATSWLPCPADVRPATSAGCQVEAARTAMTAVTRNVDRRERRMGGLPRMQQARIAQQSIPGQPTDQRGGAEWYETPRTAPDPLSAA